MSLAQVLGGEYDIGMEKEHETSVDTVSTKRARRVPIKAILGALTIAVVLAGGYVGYQKFVPQYPPMLPEALREGRFGSVATVNDVKISRERYNSALASVAGLATSNGIDLTEEVVLVEIKKAALTTIIENEVLLQAARAANITVDEAKVDEQILATSIQMGGEDKLNEELKKMGVSQKAYRNSVLEQTLLNAYIEQTISTSSVTTTDDEVEAFYDERTALADEGVEIPSFKDVKDQVRTYLENIKREELIKAHIEELVAKASIEKFLEIKEAPVDTEEATTAPSDEATTTENNAQ